MKSVLLITTGGTIACTPSSQGLVPETDGSGLLGYMGSLSQHYQITVCDLLTMDSTNIQPEEWQLMAETIYAQKDNYDAIVLTHGTDTMAYTASVLSFMLLGIQIPVVLTGAQLPIQHPLTDAVINLRCAFEMAQQGIGGVFLAFNRKVFLGCRSVKVRASGFEAFESVNFPPVGLIDADGLRVDRHLLPHRPQTCTLQKSIDNRVFLLKLTPGTDPNILPAMANLGCSGIVIEAFGAGGIHFVRRDLIGMLDVLTQRDIPVVVCSQCLYDRSDLSDYQVGRRALEKGVISGHDMTSESAVTKLMWGLGQLPIHCTDRIGAIKALFAKNLAGEIGVQ